MNRSKKIKGILLYYDVKNSNDRIYTKECAENMIQQFKDGELECPGSMYGELGFPKRFEVYLGNVSHRVKEIHLDEDNKCIEGIIEILDGTPKGQKLLKMIDNDIDKFNDHFVIRSRGSGTVNENGEIENFKLYTFDIISKENDSFKIQAE